MGRPLNKKFFGNRNIGRNGREGIRYVDHSGGGEGIQHDYPEGDDGIGGKGIASYGSIVAGSGWTTEPDASIKKPSLPGGVIAEGVFHYKALSFATTDNGTGYIVGDVLEVDTGTQTTKARAPVASILTVGVTPTISDDGTNYDSGDLVTFQNVNLSRDFKVRVVTAVAGDATVVSVEQHAVWTGAGAAPTTTAGWSASTSEGLVDNNGTGLVLSGLTWGVYAFGAVTVAGDYTGFPSTGVAGTLTSVSPATGTGAKADVTMGLLSVAVTEQGSGYVNSADAALVFDPAATPTNASGVAAFVADTGAVGSATNQENAIIARVYYDEEVQIADIVKQQGSRNYIVIVQSYPGGPSTVQDDEPVLARLVARVPQDIGEYAPLKEMTIRATDDNGNTYFVTKLTARRATLHRDTQSGSNAWLFANDVSAPWTFDSTANGRVIIENA